MNIPFTNTSWNVKGSVKQPGKMISKGIKDLKDSAVNRFQVTNPWIGALTEGKVYGLELPGMGALNGKDAATDAAAEDAANKAKYNTELERIFSRENRYSPEQLAAQKELFPMQQGMLYASLGMPMPSGSSPEGQGLWDAMSRANAMQRGQEQSALSTGYQNSSRNLMNQNRQLFGSGSSGHIANQLGNLQTQYMMQRPQSAANYNTRQTANQQGALQNMMSLAYGQPMGNQPYQPAQLAAPTVNTFLPDLLGAGAGGLMSMLPFLF